MRIALYHNLPSGGAKRHTFEQVRELARRGHELVEFAPSTADQTFSPLAPHVREQQLFPLSPVSPLRRRVPLMTPYIHAVQGLTTLRRVRRTDRDIAAAIDAGGFDLAFVKDCRIADTPYLLRYLATPSVFQCHHVIRRSRAPVLRNGVERTSWFAGARDAYYGPARALFERRATRDEDENIRSASRVLTNSRFSAGQLKARHGVTAHVVYPGINTDTFHQMDVPEGDYVLSVGMLVFSKGHRFVVSALGRIDVASRPALVIAANSSDPREEREVRALAAERGVELRVEKIADDARLLEVYSAAKAFVYAPMTEALGMAPLEAMACGTPVVAVGEGGVSETIIDGETGWLVARDEDAFAARLTSLLSDDARRQRMGAAAVAAVRSRWTWRVAVDRLESQLAQAVVRMQEVVR